MTISTPSIYKKLLAAKADFDTVLKNKANPFHKSNYADLGAILEAVEPALHKHELVLTQPIINGQLFTIITSASNPESSISSNIDLPEGLEPQKMGSAITYYRRYLLQSLLALHAEDDDAQATVKPQAVPAPTRAPEKSTPVATPLKTYPIHKEKVGDHSNYIAKFGKYKDRPLGSIGPEAICGYIKYLESDPSKMSSGAIEWVKFAKQHIDSLKPKSNGYDQTPPHSSEEIPF